MKNNNIPITKTEAHTCNVATILKKGCNLSSVHTKEPKTPVPHSLWGTESRAWIQAGARDAINVFHYRTKHVT